MTWVSGLRHTVLALQLQTPAESADAMLSNVREACASKGMSRTSSDASASGSRTSVGLVLDGVNISTVVKGSPAASDFGGSRIEPNDVLVSVDGKEVDVSVGNDVNFTYSKFIICNPITYFLGIFCS